MAIGINHVHVKDYSRAILYRGFRGDDGGFGDGLEKRSDLRDFVGGRSRLN